MGNRTPRKAPDWQTPSSRARAPPQRSSVPSRIMKPRRHTCQCTVFEVEVRRWEIRAGRSRGMQAGARGTTGDGPTVRAWAPSNIPVCLFQTGNTPRPTELNRNPTASLLSKSDIGIGIR